MEQQPQRRNPLIIVAVLISILFLTIIGFDWYFYHQHKASEKQSAQPLIDSLKHEIDSLKVKGDSLKLDADKKDSVRIVEVIKWRTLKQNPDSLPCDTFVKLVIAQCDTVIMKDSSTIAALKNVITNQDSIIIIQDKVIKLDSAEIVSLNKQIKKHRRQKRMIAAGAAGVLLLSLFR